MTFYLWLIVGLVLILAEMLTSGFILLWLGIGGLAAALAAWLGFGWGGQMGTFLVVSFLLIAASRTVFKDVFMKGEGVPTNVTALIGRKALVVQEIDSKKGTGEVKVNGDIWRAVSADEQRIPAGVEVEIEAVEGATLVVQPVSWLDLEDDELFRQEQ